MWLYILFFFVVFSMVKVYKGENNDKKYIFLFNLFLVVYYLFFFISDYVDVIIKGLWGRKYVVMCFVWYCWGYFSGMYRVRYYYFG